MSDHKINATYKAGTGYDEAWVTVGADDPEEWMELNGAFREQIAQQVAETAAEYRALNVVVRGGLGAAPVEQSAPAAQQQAAPAAAQAEPAGDLPEGMKMWKGPNPKKPQYPHVFFSTENYSAPFNEAMKAQFKEKTGRWLGYDGESKARHADVEHEGLIRSLIAANAHLLK